MRKEKSLWIPQKYKELWENNMKNYMLTNGQLSREIQPSKVDPGRNRKSEPTNYYQWNWTGNKKTSKKQNFITR